MSEPNHWRRVTVIWLASSLVLTPIVVFVLAPGLPPGDGSVQAGGQVTDNTVLLGISTPVALAVLVFFVYALVTFRERQPDTALEGPPVRGDARIQLSWVLVTGTIVLFLAGYGTVRMLADGAGGGQGPNPIAKPDPPANAKPLQVQVIGQQWQWTYRFPGYGGVETAHLELPADRTIEFHVTSIDAIHSFWAYQLGVKADANPGIDNIAYAQTKHPMNIDIHCAELCGVFHGYMTDHAQVVSASAFASWIAQEQKYFTPVAKSLPPYAKAYFPDPQRRGG